MLALFFIALIVPVALSRPENGVPTCPASRSIFCPSCRRCDNKSPTDLILINDEDSQEGIVRTLPFTNADILRNLLLNPRISSRDGNAEKEEGSGKAQTRGGWSSLGTSWG